MKFKNLLLATSTFLFTATLACAAVPRVHPPLPVAHVSLPLVGDNESGLEFPHSTDQCQWYSPDPSFAINTLHAKIIRIPYLSACAVPVEGGAINTGYMNLLKKTIAIAAAANVASVVDMHDYGMVYNQDITTARGSADFLDVHHKVYTWLKANLTPAQNAFLLIGLINEPHTQSDDTYKPVFQAAINQLRTDGFTGPIAYPEAGWSGAHNLSVNSTFMSGVVDPGNNLLAEVHQYFDSDYSGTHDVPITDGTLGARVLGGAEQWSARTGIMLILDETGDPQPVNSDKTIPVSFPSGAWTQSDQYFRQFVSDAVNSGRFFAIMPWGGGPYWGPYMFNDYTYQGNNTATGATYAELFSQIIR